MVRTAILGLDEVGREYARASKRDSASSLVGVYDPDRARAQKLGKELGVPVFDRHEELLRVAKPEVSILSALEGKEELARVLLSRGIHVLSALPVAPDAEQCEKLAVRDSEEGGILAADFHLRFTPAMDKAREWVSGGEIGSPLFVNMNLWRDLPESHGNNPYHLFLSLGAHGVDVIRQFVGDIERVQCFGVRDKNGSWTSAQINMMCSNGAVGHLTISYEMVTHHPIARCEIAGSRARVVIENVYEDTTLYVHERPEKLVLTNSIFGGIPQLSETRSRRLHELLTSVQKGDLARDTTAVDACAAARVMEAAYHSAERGSVEEVGS